MTTDARQFKAGDTVFHIPTGETWLLIRDQQGADVFPGGWPKTIARASDCRLVDAIENCPERLQSLMRE